MSPVPSSEAPVAVYQDVASWKALLLLDAGALAYLLLVSEPLEYVSAFDVVCLVLLGSTALMALLGSRRIEAGPGGIRVLKRGKVRFARPLAAFAGLHGGLFDFHAITFEDGSRVWFPGLGGEATALVDYLATVRPVQLRQAAEGELLELLVASVRFPEGRCVGCGGAATRSLDFEARRGFSLGFVSSYVYRTLKAPGCGACARRRLGVTVAAYALPVLAVLYCLFGPQLAPEGEHDRLKLALFGLALGSYLFLANWGRAFLDDRTLGLSVRSLSADSTRLWMRVGNPELRDELARLSRASPGIA